MHGDLRSLMKGTEMLLRIEAKLSECGIKPDQQDGGYASGTFGESFGDKDGVFLGWQLCVLPESAFNDDGPDEEEGIEVEARLVVGLCFGDDALFALTYDPEFQEWSCFLGQPDDDVEVPLAAVAFAKTQGIESISRPGDEKDSISEECAFEMIAAMAAYANEHAKVTGTNTLEAARGKRALN